ncbi:WESB_1763 family membrane protein [uncultured Brachyspira sp.]|uniref:WESB_1763 family membrane protein n=1 Tax=uncultured Brachyspira sp. TaxID=221953 RepID=UPI0025ECF292|nr:WESB_1763 family membrane protein [uncultured Brachyspira sp.]
MLQINKNTSFVVTYNFWSYILISAVFFNYILFRSSVIDNNSYFYTISFIFDYIVLILFYFLVFYKFYNSLFSSNISLFIFGILFLIFGTLKLYMIEINIYNIIELLYFISMLILIIKILMPIIFSKNITELERGIYMFILLSLFSSSINYILISSNKIIDKDIFHYVSIFVSKYMSKLSSFSFLILMTAYILIFIKRIIISNIDKYLIFIIILIILLITGILIFGRNFFLIMMSFFGALGIIMYLPFTVYMVIIIMFLMTLFSSFMISLLSKKYYPKLILFTLFLLSGLDMSNFSLRLISIFAIMEINAVYNAKYNITYLTNNIL